METEFIYESCDKHRGCNPRLELPIEGPNMNAKKYNLVPGEIISNKRIDSVRIVCGKPRYAITFLCCGRLGDMAHSTLLRDDSDGCAKCRELLRDARWNHKRWGTRRRERGL